MIDEEQAAIHRIWGEMTRALGGTPSTANLRAVHPGRRSSRTFAAARFANKILSGRSAGMCDEIALTAARHHCSSCAGARTQRDRRAGVAAHPCTIAMPPEARQLIVSGPNTGARPFDEDHGP